MNQQWDDGTSPAGLVDMLGSVRLGNKEYAVSLIWYGAEDGARLKAEAVDAAGRVGSSLIALRPGGALNTPQYGLGDTMLGHKPGMPSLAAAVAEQVHGSLFGVWQLDTQLWCLIGVRNDGAIVFDKASANEEAIRQEFAEGLVADAWEQIICPAAWEISGTQPAEEHRPALGRTRVRLQPLKADVGRFLLYGALVAVVCGGSYFAYGQYQDYQARRAAAQQALELAQAQASAAARNRPAATGPVRIPDMPWAGQPLATSATQACIDGLLLHLHAAAEVPGWSRDGAGRCDGKSVSYDIKRDQGTDNWVAPMVARMADRPQLTGPANGKATLKWPLPQLPVYAKDSPGTPLDLLRQNVPAQFAEMGQDFSFAAGDSQPFWQSVRYAFETPLDPMTFMPLLGTMPGALVREVDLDPESGKWKISGEIYERKQPSAADLQQLQQQQANGG